MPLVPYTVRLGCFEMSYLEVVQAGQVSLLFALRLMDDVSTPG